MAMTVISRLRVGSGPIVMTRMKVKKMMNQLRLYWCSLDQSFVFGLTIPL